MSSRGQAHIQRRQADSHIADGFDRRAALAEHDHRAEDRIGGDADHDLDRAGAARHRFDDETFNARGRQRAADAGNHLIAGLLDFESARQIQHHAAIDRFVRHVRREDLERHRLIEPACDPSRFGGTGGDLAGHGADAIGADHRLCFRLAQGKSIPTDRMGDEVAHPLSLGLELLRRGGRRFHQHGLAAPMID